MNERLGIAIYRRLSTEDQAKEGYSLDVQRGRLTGRSRRGSHIITSAKRANGGKAKRHRGIQAST